MGSTERFFVSPPQLHGELYLAGINLVPVVSAVACARLLLNIRDVTAMSDPRSDYYIDPQRIISTSVKVSIQQHTAAEHYEMDFPTTPHKGPVRLDVDEENGDAHGSDAGTMDASDIKNPRWF